MTGDICGPSYALQNSHNEPHKLSLNMKHMYCTKFCVILYRTGHVQLPVTVYTVVYCYKLCQKQKILIALFCAKIAKWEQIVEIFVLFSAWE